MKLLSLNKLHISVISAVLAAFLYAIFIPCAKILGNYVSNAILGALLYLGAGLGLLFTSPCVRNKEIKSLTKKEIPYTVAMIILDISAIVLLMFGISLTTAANVSLLSNLELVTTAIAAFYIFKEKVSVKLFLGIILITIAGIILTFEANGSFVFNFGSILVVLSCVCWGLENNCTKAISSKDTRQITIIKGLFSGMGCLIIAFLTGEKLPEINFIFISLLLGFISYGISVCLYIYSQRHIGAAKTGALYSIAPFAGVFLSLFILNERPQIQFYIALSIMVFASILVISDSFKRDNS